MREWLILRRLPDENFRYSSMVVEAESSQRAVELLTADFPDHMLGREFLVVPVDEVRQFSAKGQTTTTRRVDVEIQRVRLR